MIQLTRLDGTPVALNADLIERVETDTYTVITLVEGTRYVVVEPTEAVIEAMVQFRASILVAADHLAHTPQQPAGPRLRLVSEVKER